MAGNDSAPMLPRATALAGRRHRLILSLLLALLAAPLAQALDWQVEVTPVGELYPALHWSARAGGGDGLVAVVVSGARAGTELRARLTTPGLRAPAVAVATATGGEVILRPRLVWDASALREVDTVRRQRLQVTLDAGDQVLQRELEVRLHPLDEAAYYIRDGAVRVDLSWAFAAYVDPLDPAIDLLLADADRLAAGRAGDSDGAPPAQRRLRGAWAALAARGVRYDATDPALARGPAVWSQRVRSASQVLRERRANCIDGSVLVASLLERMGLRAQIVLVPGHAFVGYQVPGGTTMVHLETTLLGAVDFDAALRAGRQRWRRAAPRLDGHHAPDYALIDVGTARSYGIIPLGAALRDAEADAVPGTGGADVASCATGSPAAQGSQRCETRSSHSRP